VTLSAPIRPSGPLQLISVCLGALTLRLAKQLLTTRVLSKNLKAAAARCSSRASTDRRKARPKSREVTL
jgi:hypothetical protein